MPIQVLSDLFDSLDGEAAQGLDILWHFEEQERPAFLLSRAVILGCGEMQALIVNFHPMSDRSHQLTGIAQELR